MGAPRKPDVPHVAPTDEERERGFWKLCRGCDLEWSLANIAAQQAGVPMSELLRRMIDLCRRDEAHGLLVPHQSGIGWAESTKGC